MQMLPMMGGMLVSSITSGQLITRTGRYKIFPIVGTAIMTLGLFMLSRTTVDTREIAVLGAMLVLGLGMGQIIQVLVIAVQNAVDYRDLGVATSGNTLFRSVGGSVGTAVLGAIFAARLSRELAPVLSRGSAGGEGAGISLHSIVQLPPAVRATYAHGFTTATSAIFTVATVIAAIGFLLSWLLPEHRLRETAAAASADMGQEVGGAMAMPFTSEVVDDAEAGRRRPA
jgi:hypothetical protein